MIKEMLKNFQIKDKNNLTFDDFLETLEKDPKKTLRNSAMYIKDMLDFYGKNKNGEFNVFTKDDELLPPVYGQKNVQTIIYKSLKNFIKEGHNNKFLLFKGPNGSSKTSIVAKIMKGCEEYSQEKEGELHTFSWIFPLSLGAQLKSTTGLGLVDNDKKSENTGSFAHAAEDDILTILPSELKDHPILLIPLDIRRKLLHKIYPQSDLAKIKRTYIYNGDLSQKNKMIFDSLLQTYEGDLSKVFNHVRVEKFNLSKRYSKSLCTIEPYHLQHIDAQAQQITMDRRISNLPPSIEHLNLKNVTGPLVSANRGIIEYSDLFKRHPDTFKYLLMTIENKTLNMNGLLTELDILFIGSSNERQFNQFKQNPDYHSFKGRFKFIHVPYLLNYKEEEKIYVNHVKRTSNKRFEPYALECISLFNVCLRLFKPQGNNFSTLGVQSQIITNLSSMEKAFVYAKKYKNLKFDGNAVRFLKENERALRKEFFNADLYEGMLGISPREIKELIHDLSDKKSFVSFLDVISFLEELATHRLYKKYKENIAEKEHYHKYDELPVVISNLKEYYYSKFKTEAQEALSLIDNLNYDAFVEKYVKILSAQNSGEMIYSELEGKKEPIKEKDILVFEDKLNVDKFNRTQFRSSVLELTFNLKRENGKINYKEVYQDLVYDRLVAQYTKKKEASLRDVLSYIKAYEVKESSEETTKEIEALLDKLHTTYGYSKECSITLLKALEDM